MSAYIPPIGIKCVNHTTSDLQSEHLATFNFRLYLAIEYADQIFVMISEIASEYYKAVDAKEYV